MKFGQKLVVLFTVAVVLVTGVVGTVVSISSRRAFERLDAQRTEALVAQFRREFDRRGDDVARRIAALAARDTTARMAADLARTPANASIYVDEAASQASSLQLDFLEIVAADGSIVSSAQWPARFGYKEELVQEPADWNVAACISHAPAIARRTNAGVDRRTRRACRRLTSVPDRR